jgi:hypothetical protein
MAAVGCRRQVHGCSAVRAVDRLDVSSQLRDLLRRQRPDEVLLLEEIEERDQPAVIVGTAKVFEAGRALHVARSAEAAVAARAFHERAIVRGDAPDTLADQPEDAQRRAGRELQVLTRVEPDRLARRADVDLDRAAEMTIELVRLHRLRAARAGHAS